MEKTFNFTKTEIQKLPPPLKGMDTYKDTKEKGLSLYITPAGAITFFVRKRINGRDERIKIGSFPDISIEQARKKALEIKAKVADGQNPNLEKHKMRAEITFGELFNEYLNKYSKRHKKSWQYDQREVNKYLSHWFKRKISTISQYEVRSLHDKIHDQNGLYQANRILERIRGIFNKAIEWGWEGRNPAQGIKKFREKSRDRFIQPDELPLLFKALEVEENKTAKDYILISLMTGARKSNVLAMKWDEISWDRAEWRIPDTKNGEPVTVPLIAQAIELLEKRKRLTNSPWVFPSDIGTGHLADPKKAWERVRLRATFDLWRRSPDLSNLIDEVDYNLRQKNNYVFTIVHLYSAVVKEAEKRQINLPIGLLDIRLHDIRRTVGSYQAITGASLTIIGKSLGHKSQQATQIYSRLHLDPVRASMEKASTAIFSKGVQNAE